MSIDLAVLKTILSQPTAPFREQFVFGAVEQILADSHVPYFYDPHGNMLVGVENRTALRRILARKSKIPLRLMMAHTDHPGFHGIRWIEDDLLEIKWFGGSPIKHLHNADVWLSDGDAFSTQGKLRKVQLAEHRYAIGKAEVKLAKSEYDKRPKASALFGGFCFSRAFWRSGKLIYTRAADDLTGVFCVVETAKRVFADKTRRASPPFLGLLTRGEEVGFIGALAHFDLGWYRNAVRPLLCVSLEASRTLPGAEIGKGPVVRLGDRRTVFSAGPLQALTTLAAQHLPGEHQRRIMDGGACEASATTMLGFPTIGLSIPLGNYHNEAYQGGQEARAVRGPAPEFVHVDDIERLLRLCIAIAETDQVWLNPWQEAWQRLSANYQAMKKHLA